MSFKQFIFMSTQIMTLHFWFNNFCKIISKLLKKLVKLPVGDLYIVRIHYFLYEKSSWIVHTSMSKSILWVRIAPGPWMYVSCECCFFNVFYVLLTVHLSIIFVNKPTWCTIFFICLFPFSYMFRAAMCPSSGELIVSMRHLVYVTLTQLNILKLQ